MTSPVSIAAPRPSTAASARPVQPLGIGLPYISSLPAELYDAKLLDFVELTPETLARQRRTETGVSIDLLPDQLERARDICAPLPVVVHGVELSIGSAHGWNTAYLEMLDEFQEFWPFAWHSEHLGFQTIPGKNGETLEVGVPLPLPATGEAAEVVAQHSKDILRRYGVPFLLENPAYYITGLPSDPEIGDDAGLMHAITKLSGCYQLLDLHNVHCNALNHRLDPYQIIDRMPLDRVVEIHLAGGSWQSGFWMDAHNSRVPDVVWNLLEYTLPRAPNTAGIVFEMLEEHAQHIGPEAITGELMRAREIWQRRRAS